MTFSTARRLALKGALACAFASTVSFPAFADEAVLRVSAIPDEAPTELQRKFAPLGKYLEAQTGMKVSLHAGVRLRRGRRIAGHEEDRPRLAGRLHLRAGQDPHQRHGHPHRPARGRRQVHLQVHHRRPGIKSLADLKGKTFAFGAPSSTSGSLMPRFFLQQGAESGKGFQERRLLRRA
jgi:phosphonate transport system substrate-binding protein